MTVWLHKIRTLVSGPPLFPLELSAEEISAVLVPYHDVVDGHDGFLRRDNRGDGRVSYECESTASAKALHAKLTDHSIAAVKAMDELVETIARQSGATFTVSWRLTRRP